MTSALPRPSDKWIPWYIVLFFVVQTVLFVWFVVLAEKTAPGVVTEQAYEKGLAYNTTIARAKEQDALGFSSSLELKQKKIIFVLKDEKGNVIPNAKVRLVLFRPVHAGIDQARDMAWDGTGYTADAAVPEPGLWDVRIEAETDKGQYQTAKRIVFE